MIKPAYYVEHLAFWNHIGLIVTSDLYNYVTTILHMLNSLMFKSHDDISAVKVWQRTNPVYEGMSTVSEWLCKSHFCFSSAPLLISVAVCHTNCHCLRCAYSCVWMSYTMRPLLAFPWMSCAYVIYALPRTWSKIFIIIIIMLPKMCTCPMKFVQFDLWLACCNIFPTLRGAAGIAISSNAVAEVIPRSL